MNRRSDVFPIILLFIAPFILFFPVTLGQKIFFEGDFFLFYYPIRAALVRAFSAGGLPLWEPGIAMGFPLFAEGQVGALYPVNQILYRVLPIQLALGYELLLHLGWLMVGTFCYARVLGLRAPSAIFAALVFAGSGFVMENLLITNMLATVAQLPWLLLLVEKFFADARPTRRVIWFALLCVGIAFQFLSAHPQYALIDLALVLAVTLTQQWRGWRAWFVHVGWISLAVGIAVCIAAVQLLPTLELARLSQRAAGLSFDEFTIESVEPRHLVLLLAPFALGDQIPGGVVGYVGIAPLMLALASPFLERHRRVFFWSVLALIGLALAFGKYSLLYRALYAVPIFNSLRISGRFLYVFTFAIALLSAFAFDALLRALPTSARRNLWRVIGVGIAIAIEIALAYQLALREWLALWMGLPFLFVSLVALMVWATWRRKLARDTAALALIAITIFDLVAFAAVLVQSRNGLVPVDDFFRAPQSLAGLQAPPGQARVLTVGALVPPFAAAKESLYPDLGTLFQVDSVKGTTGLVVQRAREFTDSFSPGTLNLANTRYLLIPRVPNPPSDKFALRLGTEKIVFDPIPAAFVEVDSYLNDAELSDGAPIAQFDFFLDDGTIATMPIRVGNETADWAIERQGARRVPPIALSFPANWERDSFHGHTYRARMEIPGERKIVALQLRGNDLIVEHIRIVDREGQTTLLDYRLGASNHSTVYRNERVTILENADVLPRAFLAHSAEKLDDAAILARMRDYTFEPRARVLISEGEALTDAQSNQGENESVKIIRYEPERVTLTVTAERRAYVVLADTWYPGWVARVDDGPAPIVRAYHTFRAVMVDAGTHTVEFEYRPISLYIGAGISGATLIALLAGAGWVVKKWTP